MISPVDGWLLPCQTGLPFLFIKKADIGQIKMSSSNIFKTGINIPKVVKKLEYSNYHDELRGKFTFVWVNLSRAVHQEYADIQEKTTLWGLEGKNIMAALEKQIDEATDEKKSEKELDKISKKNDKIFANYLETIEPINDEMYAWYAKVFSQHENEVHHCIASEVRAIAETSRVFDNGNFWGWLTNRTQAMIMQHGNQQLKK